MLSYMLPIHVICMANSTAKLLLKNAKRKCCHISLRLYNTTWMHYSLCHWQITSTRLRLILYLWFRTQVLPSTHRQFISILVCDFIMGIFLFIACSFILRRSFIHSNTYAYCWHWMMNNLEIASIFSTCVCVFPLFECTSKCSTSIQVVEIAIKNWFEAPFEFMEIR